MPPTLLLSPLLVTACGGDPAAPLDTDGVVAAPTADWIAEVYADDLDVPVNELLLPGAFNSTSYTVNASAGISPHAPPLVVMLFGSGEGDNPARDRVVAWAKTQERTLAEQLGDGIRSIEINLTVKEGALVTWHSIYGVPVGEVLDELVAFAVAHPLEPVLLQVGLDAPAEDWPLLAEALTLPRAGGRSVCDLLYDGPGNAALATLGELRARERSLLWGPSGELRAFFEARGDCPTSELPVDLRWSLTATPAGVEAALEATVASRDPSRVLINDFAFSLDGSETSEEQAAYVAEYGSVREASAALGFSGDFPGRMIARYDVDAKMNVFAGAMYEDTDLIEAVIARSRERLAER